MKNIPDLILVGTVIPLPEGWNEEVGYFPDHECWSSATNQLGGWVFKDGNWQPTTRID